MSDVKMASLAGTSSPVSACQAGSTASCQQGATAFARRAQLSLAGARQRVAGCCTSSRAQQRRTSSVSLGRGRVVTRAMLGEPEGELDPEVDEGTKIRVTKEVTVYHAPKRPELQLQGLEGTVKSIVKVFKGKELSANLPYRVEFHLEAEGGKQQKLLVHLDASEFESVS